MNSSNEAYFSLDYWFNAFGFPQNIDIISTYIVLPTGLISFALNLLTFMVLRKELFFRSMRVYFINGAILSIICSTVFILLAQRMFSFPNTYGAILYTIYFFSTLQPMLFLFSRFLQIFIVFERSMYFLPQRFRKMQNINFNRLILFLFLFCVILHIPTFFFSYQHMRTFNQIKIHRSEFGIWVFMIFLIP